MPCDLGIQARVRRLAAAEAGFVGEFYRPARVGEPAQQISRGGAAVAHQLVPSKEALLPHFVAILFRNSWSFMISKVVIWSVGPDPGSNTTGARPVVSAHVGAWDSISLNPAGDGRIRLSVPVELKTA